MEHFEPVLNTFINCYIIYKRYIGVSLSMRMFGFILKHIFYIYSLGRKKSKACRSCREKTEGGGNKNEILPT